jgi:SAM-dependent methyltransferase
LANEFSSTWFDTFLAPETAAPVEREVNFVRTHLPLDGFPRLLDVACGVGRHAIPLARLGYDVLGIDRSEPALDLARRHNVSRATFRSLDMTDLASVEGLFDGVLCLWSSFGYGTFEQNQRLLADMSGRLREGGRLLLDVYNADALRRLPKVESEVRGGRAVATYRELVGRRFRVHQRYAGTEDEDTFDWLLYTPSQLTNAGAAVGLDTLFACAGFDRGVSPSADRQRMQMLFEKRRPSQPHGGAHA